MSTSAILLCIPFVALLLCIAIFPLVKEDWWEKYRPLVVLICSLLFIVPSLFINGAHSTVESVLECLIDDYLTFIVLLFGLFCVAGNIHVEGQFAGKPVTNIVMLAIGTFLASCIGTTGASMVLVRPVLKMNSWRGARAHVMIFFIFMISNLGGCLTPIGDPPLLMGFTHGVPFAWSLRLFPIMLFNMVALLTIFFFIDRSRYKKDLALGHTPPTPKDGPKLKITGAHNIIFLITIVCAVIISGVIPGQGIHNFGEVYLKWSAIVEVAIILLSALLSFKTTKKEIREENRFSWGAIQEVAVLFIGIFITMQPALSLLKVQGPQLGLNKAWQMFWVTGALSSFLDNTPTYLVFFTTAAATAAVGKVITVTVSGVTTQISTKLLTAISCGAVFMGANTYIGNAPNFMVKSISDENGVRMPSFFGYLGWSICILIPVFLVDTALITFFM